MSWSAQRRATIILIILGFFAVVFVIPYIVTHRVAPTCFDHKQNGDETGIDCGGSCALICQSDVKDIKILWARIFPSRPGEYDAVAYIENPNFNIVAPSVPYTFTLKDSSDSVITTVQGETWVGPNERFAIFAGNIKTGDRVPETVVVSFPANVTWYRTEKNASELSVTDKSMKDADKRPKLTATLLSHYPDTLRNIDVTAIVYDKKGTPIAVSASRVEKIATDGMAPLSFTWPDPLQYDAGQEACATPVDVVLLLDRSGTMQSEGKKPPQPLADAKDAAKEFVDRLALDDQAAYISFATYSSNPLDQTLTKDRARLKRAIDRTAIGTDGIQMTNIGDAFKKALDEFRSLRRNPDAKPVIVLLTDGDVADSIDPNSQDPKEYPSAYTISMDNAAKAEDVAVYTIGLGSASHGGFIQDFATGPTFYYPAPTRAELSDVYQQISTAICKKGPSVIEIIPRINLYATP